MKEETQGSERKGDQKEKELLDMKIHQ